MARRGFIERARVGRKTSHFMKSGAVVGRKNLLHDSKFYLENEKDYKEMAHILGERAKKIGSGAATKRTFTGQKVALARAKKSHESAVAARIASRRLMRKWLEEKK